jgi:hypothetical protein
VVLQLTTDLFAGSAHSQPVWAQCG